MIIDGGVTQKAYWKIEGDKRFLGEKIMDAHLSPTRLSGHRCRACGCLVLQKSE